MKWNRILLGAIAAGIATNIADFVMHGMIMGPTYAKHPDVFTQTPSNPVWFTVVSLAIAFTVALLFARTRSSWAPGWNGGLTYGFFVGLVGFFPSFYQSIVIDGFPYFLAWCWGGIQMIDSLIAGALLGVIVKRD